jgi:histidinol-phosphate phosphatase family protein
MGNKAVFVDRDGTMAKDAHYCSCLADFQLFSDTPRSIRLLNEHGFLVIVVTNQSGIARGKFTEETLTRIHKKMKDELAIENAFVDAVYYCPHHPDDGCECRKPKPKLVLEAVKEFGIDLSQSFVVGDLQVDIDLGKATKCKTILISKTVESTPTPSEQSKPDAVAFSLWEAVQIILRWDNSK